MTLITLTHIKLIKININKELNKKKGKYTLQTFNKHKSATKLVSLNNKCLNN